MSKYDSAGNLKWIKTFNGANIDLLTELTLDSLYQPLFAGSYNSISLTIDSTTLSNFGDYDAVLGLLDTGGNLKWINNYGGVGYDCFSDIEHDSSYNYYATGLLQNSTFNLGPFSLSQSTTNNLKYSVFLGKFAPTLRVEILTPEIRPSIQVYPNPTSDNLFICGAKGSEFSLHNSLGNLVASGQIDSDHMKMPLAQFGSGAYILSLNSVGTKPPHRIKVVKW